MPTTTPPVTRDTAVPPARTTPRRRPRLVPDDTGVRLRDHAARDRDLLEVLQRFVAA